MIETIPTILAPTASGKTNLAINLAKKVGGEVIGLDSRQIYNHIPIGTAQPTKKEMKDVPHHLIGGKSVTETVNAGEYAKLVHSCIEQIKSRDKMPILCGGAGLYFRALNSGIFDQSKSELKIRKNLEDLYDGGNAQEMMSTLKKIDPEYYIHVHINNRKRLIRALEIYEGTGKTPSEHFKNQKNKPTSKLNLFSIYLNWDRSVLRDRISKRTARMIKNGWIDEVRKLIEKYPGINLHPLDSIGYRQIVSYLNNNISLESLESEINTKTYQYAVRQIKWFKKESINLIIDMNSGTITSQIIKKILPFIK